MRPIDIKIKIKKWERSLIRDRWGNLNPCHWNKIAKEEIAKLEKLLDEKMPV